MGNKRSTHYAVAWGAVLFGGIMGLVASFVLSIEALTLAKDADAVLPCSVNAVLNCATVAKDASAEVLGFPNSFIGMVTFPVVITIAVVGIAGVSLPRWFIIAGCAGVSAGLLFAIWMFYQSNVVIQALCPWCLSTDFAMVVIAYGMFRVAARMKVWGGAAETVARFSYNNYDLATAVGVVVLATAAVIVNYGADLFA